MLAAQDFENVYVVDSMNATLGEQILVKYALQLVEDGLSAADIAAELERVKPHCCLIGMPDTLEYLHRGGRVSKTVALLGGALAIKPVLRLVDGEVVMIGKARGSKNGNNYLIQEVNKSGVDFSKPLCLGYTGLSDAAAATLYCRQCPALGGKDGHPPHFYRRRNHRHPCWPRCNRAGVFRRQQRGITIMPNPM